MKENTRTHYSAEEKMNVVLGIMTKKTNVQTISAEKGIAPTLISLWKRQALDAMEARFASQRRGRRKPEVSPAQEAEQELKAARHEARNAKIRASHLENSLRETREKLARVEEQLAAMAALFGCKLEREVKPRKPRKPREA